MLVESIPMEPFFRSLSYSSIEEEKGTECGTVQTLFLKVRLLVYTLCLVYNALIVTQKHGLLQLMAKNYMYQNSV